MGRRGERTPQRLGRIAGVLALCLVAAAPAVGQDRQDPGRREADPRAGRGTIEVLVDGAVKRTFSHEELTRLATETWENARGRPHPAIGVWTLVTEAGVSRDGVKALRLRTRGGRDLALTGETLTQADQYLLRTGRKMKPGVWRLVTRERPTDASAEPALPGSVVRLEVVTGPEGKP
ncbi:MAG: hypothetical protein ACREMB_24880 [Candidatus Rokuibacteriota bacterium]